MIGKLPILAIVSFFLVERTSASLCAWQGGKYVNTGIAYECNCGSDPGHFDSKQTHGDKFKYTYEYQDALDSRNGGLYLDQAKTKLNDNSGGTMSTVAWEQSSPTVPHEIIFDLGEVVQINHINLVMKVGYSFQAPTSIAVSFSDDGVTYGNKVTLDSTDINNILAIFGPFGTEHDVDFWGAALSAPADPGCEGFFRPAQFFKMEYSCPEGPAVNAAGLEQRCGLVEVDFFGFWCWATMSGVCGDPHFTTWKGAKYDFHGVCDMVLLQNPGYKNNVGMDIHIRTKKARSWSYVSNAALRIGDDFLEVQGGKANNYWINGIRGDEVGYTNMTLSATISDYPIRFQQVNAKSRQFTVDLGDDESITFTTWNAYVRVDIHNAKVETFGNSLGLLGSFGDGWKVARDTTTVIQDSNSFGQEWQVMATDPELFHNIDGPQYPEKCIIPSAADLRRRLAQPSISREDAELACSRVEQNQHSFCVFDVMATSDKDAADAY